MLNETFSVIFKHRAVAKNRQKEPENANSKFKKKKSHLSLDPSGLC